MKLRKLYEQVLGETERLGFLAYHGSPTEFESFSDEFVGGEEATDQEGPGVYFTTNRDNAAGYGGNLYTAKLNGNFITDDSSSENANETHIEQLIRMAEEWEYHAQNWAEDPEIGLRACMSDMYQYNDNEKDVFLQVWIEFYRYDAVNFVRNMTKLGYDGVVVDRSDDRGMNKHIIVYNPSTITLIDKEVISEELTYRHADTEGVEDDEYEIGMVKEDTNTITLYHGSQRKLNSKEGFSTKYVLSGEGNNIFGWGLYFTDIIEIAKTYARNNASNEINRLVSLASDIVGNQVNDVIEFFEMQDWDGVSKDFKNLLYKNKGKTTDNLVDKGYLYSVTLTPSKPKAFQWYETISDNNITKSPMKGKDIYKNLIKELGSEKEVSLFLYKKGYYGITYPTGTLSGDHDYEQGLNYVIFNDKDIKISNIDRL